MSSTKILPGKSKRVYNFCLHIPGLDNSAHVLFIVLVYLQAVNLNSINAQSFHNMNYGNTSYNTLFKDTKPDTKNNKTEAGIHGSGLCFTPNKGQLADKDGKLCPDILYKGEGGSAEIYLRKTGISYVYSNMSEVMNEVDKQVEELNVTGVIRPGNEQEKKQELMQAMEMKIHRVDMDFADCNQNINTTNEYEVDGYQNFYYAHCPQGITKVKQYNKVTYKNIYNGIDIAYFGSSEKGLKYDLIVQPHADPNQIKLHWKGAESIFINSEGHLVIKTRLNEITESIPKVYQIINGKVVDVKAKYKIDVRCEMLDLRENILTKESHISCLKSHIYEVAFELGPDGYRGWNPSYALVIDPWATYYGGAGNEYGYSVACDNTGHVYMAGTTNSPNAGNVIAAAPGFQTVLGGGIDAFLVKFNSTTGARIWATYYGGTGRSEGYSTACDNADNVYLAGTTSSIAGIASTAGFQTVLGGGGDAFLVKFDPTGARIWATYYGGTGAEYGFGVACDNKNNVYLAGYTNSSNTFNEMAITPGFQTVLGNPPGFGTVPASSDAFLVKFNSTTGMRIWATYYGGINDDKGYSVACDNTGNVYLAGKTQSSNINNVMAIAPGFQTVLNGFYADAFLVNFNSVTGTPIWATYYGGTGTEYGFGVACDNSGNVYLAGYTDSPNTLNVIATPGSFQTGFGGGLTDVFLVQFNSATGARNWGTYYGSNLFEYMYYGCLAIDGSNNVYLYIEVEDAPAPALIDPCAYQPNYAGGGEDQMIVKFNPAGKKLCATYFGGSGYEDLDWGGGIAISGNLLFICTTNGENYNGPIAGTMSGGYPATPGAHQTVPGGGGKDAVLASLCINICEGKISLGLSFTAATSVCANTPVTFTPTVANSCDTTGYKFHWSFTGGNPASSDSVTPTVTFSGVGAHDVKLVVTTICKKDSITKTNYISINPCSPPCLLTGQFTKGTASCTDCGCKEWILVNASGGTNPYSYSWPDGYNNRYKNHLCPGAYTINIKDKNGCSVNINLNAP